MSESTLAAAAEIGKPNEPQEKTALPNRTPKGTSTEGTIQISAGKLTYAAVADWMILRKREKPVAEMFFVYYSVPSSHPRPVTFVFNGGPGAASAYLHVGAVGPRRVMFADDGALLPPPTRLTDNESTWLSFTDLVFVDPIGTGFSRTIDEDPDAKGEKSKSDGKDTPENKDFYKLNRDLESLGEFISKFLSKFKLWSRPVFIAGESYGGFRVAKLARKLQEGYGVGLNGAILISPALEFTLLEGSDYDIQMWSDLFPSFVASAVYHGRSKVFAKGTPHTEFLSEVERFAVDDLVRYLALAGSLPESEQKRIAAKASSYLGIEERYFTDRAGRIGLLQYSRELLRDERKIMGLYDASLTAIDPFPDRETFQGADPTLSSIERVFTAGINMHVREALKVETEREYHLISLDVNMSWSIDEKRHALQTQIGATDDLRYAMALNPHMKVFITHGVYDLVTPYFSSNRLAAMMKLTPDQKKNLTVQHFQGGHMFYAWKKSRNDFRDAMERFYDSAYQRV